MVTRVTNSMMSRTLLNNLGMNLHNLDKLNGQLASGRKYAHISDNPSALIYGQAARNKLARLGHYQATVSTSQNWLVQAEDGIMELQKVVGNIYEELINAGGPKTIDDRQNIGMMVNQMRNHYLDTLNASYGDRFVFAGYNTPGDFVSDTYDPNTPQNTIKPFTTDDAGNLYFNGFNVTQFDGMPLCFLAVDPNDPTWQAQCENFLATKMNDPTTPSGLTYDPPTIAGFVANWTGVDGTAYATVDEFTDALKQMHRLMNDVLSFDVGPGISMPVTINGLDAIFFETKDEYASPIVRNMFTLLNEVHDAIIGNPVPGGPELPVSDGDEIYGLTRYITMLQDGQNHLLVKTADIGGRNRRLEMLEARYEGDYINYESMRSDAEDADLAEVIMYLKMAETVYQAALSAGARIIQPSLMDFMR